ncbi:MAG TPA: type I-U CRISPR-associated protein Csb2 [Verrucomicrobiae bacterium]|nr:type I-U CRISPR-associated protein Csb2 [Verrucomicrobiae bacterium]
MPDFLCISIRFLGGAFHGRADHGETEWPPSPLRLYQAIVAASAARWNERGRLQHADAALRWLEQLPPPVIVAPPKQERQGYQLYVPDNVADLVAKQWSAGKYFDGKNHPIDISGYRTEKSVRPLAVPDEAAVHYVWPLAAAPAGFDEHRETLTTAVRSITHVGWGVDLVVADVSMLDESAVRSLKGERWQPGTDGAGTPLRTPATGTLDDLNRRHHAFLNRITANGGLVPVPPLTVFGITDYCSDLQAPKAPQAVFVLRKPDDSGFRAYDSARRGLHVGGMFRHTACKQEVVRSVGWSNDDARRIILGHGETPGGEHKPVEGGRVVFVPLPSIEVREGGERVVGSVRRVLVTARGNLTPEEFRRFTTRLDGQELTDEKSQETAALIFRHNENDGAIRPYFEQSATWATVTPVILPGYDDPRKLRQRLNANDSPPLTAEGKAELLCKLDQRIELLLRKAIRQAGFSEAMAQQAELDWRSSGFWPGVPLASQYAVPEQHRRFRRLHVRITWRSSDGQRLKVRGPICIGGGKHSGLGLFAAFDDSTHP